MNGMHLRGARSLAPSIGIVSLLALLALACFPVFAQAAGSAEIEYSDAPPPVMGNQSNGPSATSSGTPGSKSPAKSGSSAGSKSKNGSSSKKGGASAKAGGHGNGQGTQGEGSIGRSSKVSSGQLPGEAASSSGSSPLVPILIAIVVLAAISVGVVLIRRKRERDAVSGTSVPSEAGN